MQIDSLHYFENENHKVVGRISSFVFCCSIIIHLDINNYFHIIRPKNLAIVALSQLLMYMVYIMPLVSEDGIVLGGSLWWLFIIDTVLIAASGYVINDIFDQKSDLFNKPSRLYIGTDAISVSFAWYYYFGLVLVGFAIALFIAFQIDKMHLLGIYPFAVGSLYLYSKYFKKWPLIGNLVVAIFCAFVPGILLYAEWEVISVLYESDRTGFDFIVYLFIAYISFAFLSTMVRELIKDLEDAEGDRLAGYKTLPIATNQKTTKGTSILFGVLLLLSYAIWVLPFYGSETALIVMPFAIFMALFTLVILYLIVFAENKYHFTQISKRLKILMIVSLFIFLCIPIIIELITSV